MMNIKKLLGFKDNRELEDYFVSAIVMFLAILCLSYMANCQYMLFYEYVIFVLEIFIIGIIGYKMMINDEYSILIKIGLICFPLAFQLELILLKDCLYLGLFVLVVLIISLLYYMLKYKPCLSIKNRVIQLIAIMTMILALALPLEVIYQCFFKSSIFMTSETITITDEIETVMLLQEDEWQNLSLKEKENVLQTIVQIELNELGVYDIPTLRYDNLDEMVLGKYIDNSNTIVIDKNFLNNGESLEIIEAVIHECRHKYQYIVVATYNLSNEDALYYNYVKLVKESIDNYVAYSEDIDAYYNNYIEIDAANYADMRIETYKKILN